MITFSTPQGFLITILASSYHHHEYHQKHFRGQMSATSTSAAKPIRSPFFYLTLASWSCCILYPPPTSNGHNETRYRGQKQHHLPGRFATGRGASARAENAEPISIQGRAPASGREDLQVGFTGTRIDEASYVAPGKEAAPHAEQTGHHRTNSAREGEWLQVSLKASQAASRQQTPILR